MDGPGPPPQCRHGSKSALSNFSVAKNLRLRGRQRCHNVGRALVRFGKVEEMFLPADIIRAPRGFDQLPRALPICGAAGDVMVDEAGLGVSGTHHFVDFLLAGHAGKLNRLLFRVKKSRPEGVGILHLPHAFRRDDTTNHGFDSAQAR